MAHGEGETTLYCAFNFPGVLLTVNASRWDALKESYMMLVKDVQWKVRRSLAHSLHEVAAILGTEVTEADICEQVFDVFLKDLDEVRVGVLKNFAAFMKVLSPEKRKTYLEVLTQSYLEQDNIGRDWRVRKILASEIGPLTAILELSDIQETLEPTLFKFATDPVAQVRSAAHEAFGPLLLRYQKEGGDFALRDGVISKIQSLIDSDKFIERQIYVHICEKLSGDTEEKPPEGGDGAVVGQQQQQQQQQEQQRQEQVQLLEEFFLEKALTLGADKVANVRLAVARLCATLVKERASTLPLASLPPLRAPGSGNAGEEGLGMPGNGWAGWGWAQLL